MLKWLKKFVLDILPSVAATIIGAYIVNHYIVPKSQSGSQPSISSAISDAFASKSSDAVVDKASFEKGVAEKTAIEKTAEKAANDKATAAEKASDGASDSAVVETRKARPASKVVAKPTPKSVESAPAPTAAPDERRASDLARAALERQRNSANAELAKAEPPKISDAPHLQTVSTTGSVPPPMQPLPPAISIATPNADVFEQGNAAPVLRQPYPQPVARADDSRRFVPPADIPRSRPLDLRAEGSTSSSDRTSVTDEVVSVAKSMFHAVMPQ